MDVPSVVREQIIRSYQKGGLTQREIARVVGVTQGSVSNIVKLFRETGGIRSRRFGKTPSNRLLTPKAVSLLTRESQKDPRATARQLKERVGGPVAAASVRTVRRYLQKSGRLAYRPVPAPALTNKQKQRRLEWARRHQNWTVEDWSKVGCRHMA
jgi:transposase